MAQSSFIKRLTTLIPLFLAMLFIFAGIVGYRRQIAFLEIVELKTIDLRLQARA